MSEPQPVSWVIDGKGLPDEGCTARLEMSAEARQQLAKHAGILGLDRLSAEAALRPWAGGIEARVRFVADVVQACVVTLEPVEQHIEADFVRRFLPAAHLGEAIDGAVEIDPDEEDPPEPLTGDMVDLGPSVAEELVLSLDPYPRAAGAAAPAEGGAEAHENSPFAVLKSLKDRT